MTDHSDTNSPTPQEEKPKIQFNRPSIRSDPDEPTGLGLPDVSDEGLTTDQEETIEHTKGAPSAIPSEDDHIITEAVAGSKKIRAFVKGTKTEESWLRQPCCSGEGATHVRTFHAKLSDEALAYMDSVINEWLAKHPECDVKLVNTAIGSFTGKVKEPALICQVWV